MAIAVLGSGRGTNFQALVEAISAGALDARIVCVLSNVENAFILERARRLNIPAEYVSPAPFKTKLDGPAEQQTIDRLHLFGAELIVLAGAMLYLFIRFGLAALLRKYTVHRGMFHSLPAAIIFGEVAFLLASGSVELRIYKAGGVALGYLIHLLLDELYSIEWSRGRLRLKKSFGTAMKLFGRNWWPNITTYVKLAVFTFIVLKEPGWMQQNFEEQLQQPVEQTAANMVDRMMR